jgi:site-specific DNA-cytosine methylase
MRFLNLCSGTGSVSRPFVENGWEVIEVDIDPRYGPTHVVDLNDWDCPYETGFFDVIWASPDCTQYSRARTTAKEPRNLEKADRLVKRCLELISICNHVYGSWKTQIRAC